MSIVAQLKQKKAQLEIKETSLKAEIKGLSKSVREKINHNLHPVSEMDIPTAAALMDEMVIKQGEFLSLQIQLGELNEELGE